LISTLGAEATNRDERNLLDAFVPDIVSNVVGGTAGVFGRFMGQQENKKCYYSFGLGFSGPESIDPERWNDALWDEEEKGGLINAAGDAMALAHGAMFGMMPEKGLQATCLGYGMGYKTQQPGYPSKPGTCPGSKFCPPPGQYIPGQPGQQVTTVYQGQPGRYVPGQPGYQTTTTYNPGQPPQYQPGSPGYQTTIVQGRPPQYNPGQPPTQTTTYNQGNPPQYNPGTPPTQTTTYNPGNPPQYNPGQPPTQTVTTIPGRPGTYQPGTPGSITTITIPGQPPQCSCPCQG